MVQWLCGTILLALHNLISVLMTLKLNILIKKDVLHLIETLTFKYKVKYNLRGKHFPSYELDRDYEKEIVKLCMSKYIMNALKRLNYSPSISSQYSLYHYSYLKFY